MLHLHLIYLTNKKVLKNFCFSALLFYFIIRLFLNFFLAYFINTEENEAYCYKSCKKNCNPFCNTCNTLRFKVQEEIWIYVWHFGIKVQYCCPNVNKNDIQNTIETVVGDICEWSERIKGYTIALHLLGDDFSVVFCYPNNTKGE